MYVVTPVTATLFLWLINPHMKTIPLVLLLSASIFTTVSGQQTISGNVFDSETNEPLIGATVLVRSNHAGSLTNTNGQFTVMSSGKSDTLEISYIGYEKQRIVSASTNLSIALSPSVNNLQQI